MLREGHSRLPTSREMRDWNLAKGLAELDEILHDVSVVKNMTAVYSSAVAYHSISGKRQQCSTS